MTRTLTKENISVTIHESFGPGTILIIEDSMDDQKFYLYLDDVKTILKLAEELLSKSSKPPDDEL